MKTKKVLVSLLTVALLMGSGVVALADTIRLKDGSVIRGQIIGFRDQQFTVLIGSGTRGRRSRVTLYVEDVESVEFEAAGTATADAGTDDPVPATSNTTSNRTGGSQTADNNRPASNRSTPPTLSDPAGTTANSGASQRTSAASPSFFTINVRVRADNSSNGWTNSGLVVRRGQRLRISATGRVSLGGGRFSTPTGLPRVQDDNKLMRNDPTGGLIAVVGDDNDEFIFVGSSREFVAQRDGVLFLGVNESNLNDNSGTYDAIVEAEAASGTGGR